MFQAADGSVCLWDGRLDNRRRLLDKTGLPSDCADAAVALACYRKKEIEGLREILGDWSLCIWDALRREIVLASDYAGIRPLYYHLGDHALCWSTSLTDLVRWLGINELDETYVGGFLLRGDAASRTLYAGILSVPAGHAISIGPGKCVDRAFWSLPVEQETRYPDEGRYQERLAELFRESVRTRLATATPTCAELSGGLDSSSVVCMADQLRRESAQPSPALITFSYTQENSPDERFFREVEKSCDVTPHRLELREYPAIAPGVMGTAPEIWEPRYRSLARQMAELGANVLLTGQFGDFVMGNTPDDTGQVAELLAHGHFVRAARTAYGWAHAMQAPIYPILWRGAREAFSQWTPPTDPNESVGAIPMLTDDSFTPAFRARIAPPALDGSLTRIPAGRRRRFRAAAHLLRSRKLQTPEALQHISYTHPFAHRPLLEFMLTVPAHIVVAPGQPRRLMRRAFTELLPAAVLNRKSKGSYTSTYRDSFLPLATALLQGAGKIQLVERGYLERESLLNRLENYTKGFDCNETQLRQVLALEFWLRARMAPATQRSPFSSQAANS
jgi:asparagine synthase (glutamine-hydrolysing)